MSPGTIALIVVAVSLVAWALFMANLTIRRGRRAALATSAGETTEEHEARGSATSPAEPEPAPEVKVEKVPPKERKPLTPDQLAVSRRQFLNRAWTTSFLGFLGFFGMSSLSFLWPTLTGGFGTPINIGKLEDIIAKVGPDNNFLPLFNPEGRFWLVYYDGTGDDPVYELIGASEFKLQALYRKCVHLGCSVPHCSTSMLFECPCHGSKYRLTGEYFGGPAPRGLDRFPLSQQGDDIIVDTGSVQVGPPRGTDTWGRFSQPVGSFCVPT